MEKVDGFVEELDEVSGVLSLTIDRQEFGNALSLELANAIATAFESHRNSASCVILGSRGSIFCSGADLGELLSLGAEGNEEHVSETVYGTFQAMIKAVAGSPIPVIARVQGPALGAGADLALACDIRVAADSAWLEESWIRLGTISALGGAFNFVRTLGHGAAMDALLTARRIGAAEARAGGLFQRVVPLDELDREVGAIAERISSADPEAVKAAKRLVVAAPSHNGIVEAMAAALAEQVPLIARPVFAERVGALVADLEGRNK